MLGVVAHTYLRFFPVAIGKSFLSPLVSIPRETVEVTRRRIRWQLDCSSQYAMRVIFLFGEYEANTLRHLRKLFASHEKLTIVDVGANVGAYSVTLAKRHTNSSVIAFEPNPNSAKWLKRNIELNDLSNIEFSAFALGDSNGVIQLGFRDANLGTASQFDTTADHTIDVKKTTLDSFLGQRNVETVDLLKVDIEGGELMCLDGAKEVIRRSANLIIVMECIDSVCERAGHSASDLFETIVRMGFEAYLPKAWPFPLKKVAVLPRGYWDNIIFIRQRSEHN